MPKMIYCPIHPALYMCAPEHLASMCMYAYARIWKKEKNLLAKKEDNKKMSDKLLLHLFLCEIASFSWTKSNQKRKMFLSTVKVKPYVHPIPRDFKRELSLMESCDVRQTGWLHMRLQFLYLNPHVLHSLGFFPELSWVRKGQEGGRSCRAKASIRQ